MCNIPAETDAPVKSSAAPDGTEDVNLSHFLNVFFHQVPAILYIKAQGSPHFLLLDASE